MLGGCAPDPAAEPARRDRPEVSVELLTDPQAWLAFVTLTALEVVLGIDNIIFISILVDRLPAHRRARARTVGLALAMAMRILLLLSTRASKAKPTVTRRRAVAASPESWSRSP
jgi:hypothetical protein